MFDIIYYRFLFKLAGKSNSKYQFTKGSKTTLQERELHSVKCQALLNLETCLTERTGRKEIKLRLVWKKNTINLMQNLPFFGGKVVSLNGNIMYKKRISRLKNKVFRVNCSK